MTSVQDFIYNYEGQQQAILQATHDWLSKELDLTSKLRYKIPFYYRKSWVCYLNPGKKAGVELSFTRGNELSNAQGLLESKGRKQVFSITLMELSEIPWATLNEVVQEALLLDETVPYASKRKP